jgi:hypothetical protein
MIRIYCRGMRHGQGEYSLDDGSSGGAVASSDPDGNQLCLECRELADYAKQRYERCPISETRTFCQFCEIHCYSPAMRERISKVMRFAGPRMLLYHPAMALRHLAELRHHKRRRSS